MLFFIAVIQTYLSIFVPEDTRAVDEEIVRWIKLKKPNLLGVTTAVPENDGVRAKLRVTVFIKLDSSV